MMFFNLIKIYWKPTKEMAKTYAYKGFIFFVNVLPLIAIIIGANVAWKIHKENDVVVDAVTGKGAVYHTVCTISGICSRVAYKDAPTEYAYWASKLKVVGSIPEGLQLLKSPTFKYDWGKLFLDVLPLTLIDYMEAYSIARRIAAQRKELHLLSINQELYALGFGNLLGSVAQSYPVTGSYSRSALNNAAGARTPMSKVITLSVLLLALGVLTKYFFYIPNAALSAVIWVALFNLLSFHEMWDCWKYSKSDFVVVIITFVFTFVYDTSVGLAIGIGASFGVLAFHLIFSPTVRPRPVEKIAEQEIQTTCSADVHVVSLGGDLSFLSAFSLKAYFDPFFVPVPEEISEIKNKQEYLFRSITYKLDEFFGKLPKPRPFPTPPKFIIDFSKTFYADISGMIALKEIIESGRAVGVRFSFVNFVPETGLQQKLTKFGVIPDVDADADSDSDSTSLLDQKSKYYAC